jgi:hypothetical protein
MNPRSRRLGDLLGRARPRIHPDGAPSIGGCAESAAVPCRRVANLLWAGLCLITFAASRQAFAEDLNLQQNAIADPLATVVQAAPHSEALPKNASRWKVSVEAIALERSNSSASETLVSRVPGSMSFLATASVSGTEAFNSSEFRSGFVVGPRITVAYQEDLQYGWELSYFNVLNFSASRTIGPENPLNWYVMKAPGTFPSFWQTQDFPDQGMTWASTTDLYGAELNVRSNYSGRLKLAAGFRWIQLNDGLVGSLTPSDTREPAWKASPYPCGFDPDHPTLIEINACAGAAGPLVDAYPPFWVTRTKNNLFGLQVGAEGIVLESGRLSLTAGFKAGIYDNRATHSAWVSMQKQVYYASATRNGAAFVGEGRVELRFPLASGLLVRLGYELLWLDRVALAPGQISQTYSGINPTSETATGVNAGSNVLFQGGTLGLEYSF